MKYAKIIAILCPLTVIYSGLKKSTVVSVEAAKIEAETRDEVKKYGLTALTEDNIQLKDNNGLDINYEYTDKQRRQTLNLKFYASPDDIQKIAFAIHNGRSGDPTVCTLKAPDNPRYVLKIIASERAGEPILPFIQDTGIREAEHK